MNVPPLRRPTGRRALPLLLSAALLIGAGAAHAQKPEARTPLALRHTAPALPAAQKTGRTDGLRPLALTLVLPLRNRAMLDAQIKRISDPQDALYGHYLTPEEFAQQFGPDQSDVDAVSAFARSHGLTVKDVSADSTLVHVSGPAASVEAAFGVRLNDYVGTDGRAFFAADREPTAAPAVAGRLLSVLGLSNAQKPINFSRPATATPLITAFNGTAGLAPRDVKNIYGLTGTAFTGTGQVAGLFETGTYTQSDVNTYFTTYGISIPVHPVSVDGYSTTSAPGGAAAEVTLDVDMLAALAPNLSQIRVYECTDQNTIGFTQLLVDTFTAMSGEAAANRPNVISVSYGISENFEATADYQALDQATAHLAAQGQTVCVSSGDAGAYTDQSAGVSPNASFPADDPYVLCVGGTDLNDAFDAGNNCVYVSETSWSDTADKGRGPIGTGGGGGFSAFFPFPTYQAGSFTAAGNPQGSTTHRNVPDVSLYGDYDTGGYDVYFSDPVNGAGWGGYNGTSASSPLWAAFLADVNQARAAKSLAAIGFSNPAIYKAAESTAYATLFHDVADGSNNLFYKAVKGYDNSTGWGSLRGSSLLTALSASAAAAPTITSFTPISGPIGTSVAITGTSFTGATSVKIGGTAATFTVSSATQIIAKVAAGTATGTISVTTPGGTATSTTAFTVTAPAAPTITSFTPATGPVGTVVTITGTNFIGATSVKIGGTAATFAINAATKITAKVAAGTATGTITVTTAGGTATSATVFTVTASPAPTVTSFTPATGPVGTSVTITGTNFTGTTSVKINGTAATFTVNAATKITAKVAVGTSTGKITVTTPGGAATSATVFTVTVSTAPTVTTFTPASGPVGTSVLVNGTNLSTVSGVKFGTVAATTFAANSNTQIQVIVPTGAVTGKITVTTPSGTATSSAVYTVTVTAVALSAFSYNPNPGFSSGLSQGIVTLSGPAPAGGASVAITNNGNTLTTVVIPAGQTSGSYAQPLPTVTAGTTFPIAATYGGVTINVSLVVNPTSVTLSGFSLSPNPVASGGAITTTVTLSAPAPAGGAAVTITQAGVTLGYVPVAAGSTSVSFTLTAPTETTPTVVSYGAAYNGASRTVNETVN